MNVGIQLEDLRAAIKQGNMEWQKHSFQRMIERGVSREEVIEVVLPFCSRNAPLYSF